MLWLLEDLLGAKRDMNFCRGLMTQALACRYCGRNCLQSPGNLVILFLFMFWQFQRWWRPLQSWCSGNMKQHKGLSFLCHLAFFDHLWKWKPEEEKEEEEGEEEEEDGEEEEEDGEEVEEAEEEQSSSPASLKPCSPPKESSIGKQDTTASPQPSCASGGLSKAIGTQEQTFTQPSSPFRSFPIILTNPPVQRKSQLFWGLPSLHSDSLETTLLSSNDSYPLKLSVYPSVFFNKVALLPKYFLLLPHYGSQNTFPLYEARTTEDLEGAAPDSQLVPPQFSSCVPSLSTHLKPTHQREIPWVSDNQALHPQPELQRIRTSKFLPSSEAWWGVSWNPRFHQHNPVSSSASPLYSSSPLGVLTRSEAPLKTIKQNEYPKSSEPANLTSSPISDSLPELQRVSPVKGLSGSKDLWETKDQKKNPHISEDSILGPCQAIVPMTEPPGNSPTEVLPELQVPWGTIRHKKRPQACELSIPLSCQLSAFLPELPKVNPKGGFCAPKNFWGNMEYRENPQVKFPMPVPCSSIDSLSTLQEKRPPEDACGYEPQWACRGNRRNPEVPESLSLDLNPELCESGPGCVPPASGIPCKDMQNRETLWVSTGSVSSPSFPKLSSAPLLQSVVVGPQGVLLESKAPCDIKGQRRNLWVSTSSDPAHGILLAPLVEPHRVHSMDDLLRLEATKKDTEYAKNSWASEPSSLALSPPPTRVLEPLRVTPKGVLSDAKARCRNIQSKNPWTTEFPDPSLLHDLSGVSLQVPSDSEPTREDMKQQENYCVSLSPVRGPSSPTNSVLKTHSNEPFRNQSKCKPAGDAVEQKNNCQASELPAPSSLSTLPQPHPDSEFVHKNLPQKQVPSPPVVDPLHPISCPPILAEAPKIEPTQPALQKGQLFTGARAEAPSSQSKADSGVLTHTGTHSWQWSRTLAHRLKKLQHSSPFRASHPGQQFCSSPVPSSRTPDSWGLSSGPSQKAHPPHPYPQSSSSHPPIVQSTVSEPVHTPHCHHSFSSSPPQPQVSGEAEQGSQNEKMKRKRVAHRSCDHKEANENHPGWGKSSNTGVLTSSNRQNKASALSLPEKGDNSPRKSKAEECGGRNCRLGLFSVQGKNHPAQSWSPAEAPARRLLQRSQLKGQGSEHRTLPQQLPLKASDPQDQQRAEPTAADNQKPPHCKRCPWAHTEEHVLTPILRTPISRESQRVSAKFWVPVDPCPPNAVGRKKANSSSTQYSSA